MARVQARPGGRQMTKQSEGDACNINLMLARWLKSGVVKITGQRPQYGDFSNVDAYHAAVNRLQAADDEFMRIPAAVRKRAENDVGKFLELVLDQANRDELMELGLDASYFPEVMDPAPPPEPEPPVPPATPPVVV